MDFKHILNQTGHRPFPLPAGPWIATQRWNHLLYAHWPVPVSVLREKIPSCLEMDTYDNQAWIGVIPFYLNEFRPRYLPPFPFAHAFPELNVRTYVKYKGIPGIYFFSLDAASHLAVKGARSFFHLPYRFAKMNIEVADGRVHYLSRRQEIAKTKADFLAHYKPAAPPFHSNKESLDYWLAERYRFYTVNKNKLYYVDIHHEPWPLQQTEAEIRVNSVVTASAGFELPDLQPVLHYSKTQKVLFWPLRQVDL
ncbi:YqjF family protein [Fictibacillus fluitans]|uniref:DUF2071 domain-containing protein n=1 Tax=Fictibacillus fluitans TaxID=3058422 RepID=A0ABT8HYT2_9BACL|nr:DUF2071 domain-containing protein [Fictibacillus sp. NE201]MDN4525874.1 DUF2071 domain-containing protein [Fictibacillus sp. NE201]